MRSRAMVAALVPALVLAGFSPLPAADQERNVRIVAALANVRAQPSPRAPVILQLRSGDTARLLGSDGEWHHVETNDGRRGYVFQRLTEVLAPAPPPPPPAPEPVPAPAAPDPPAVTVQHDDVGCVVRNEYPRLDACLAPTEAVGKAEIHFRAAATDPWYAVELKPGAPCHSAFLPKPGRGTGEFQYYVSGVDRSMSTFARPAGAPAEAFRVRVVKEEDECGALARIARSMKKVAAPIVVAVVRDAAGLLVAAESAAAASALAGFATEGVVMAAKGAAAASASGSAAGAGAGGAGGGMSLGTIGVVAGGAIAAAAVAAAAAGGGGGDGGGSAGGGGGGGGGATTPTAPPAISLTGRWNGSQRYAGSGSGFGESFSFDCTTNFILDLAHSGSSLSGTGTWGNTTCTINLPFEYRSVVPASGQALALPPGSTASNGTITITFPQDPCPPLVLRGAYSQNRWDATGQGSCSIQGVSFQYTATMSATR